MSSERPCPNYGVPPQIEASFVVGGRNFDARRVTEILRYEPSSVWLQRHEHLRERVDLENVQWVVTAGPRNCYSVSEVVEELVLAITPLLPKLTAAIAELNVKAAVVATVRIKEDRPLYDLSRRAIKLLVGLDCEFLLDVYDLSPAPNEG